MPKNWNRRFKHNRDKMKTGDIFELAEVVQNLSLRDHEKGLSTGEKQMFVKAKKILASELMYAKDIDEEEAAEWLEDVLAESATASEAARRRRSRQGRRGQPCHGAGAVDTQMCASGRSSSPQGAASASARTGRRRSSRLGGRALLAESLERLDDCDVVDAIVVAAPAGWEEPAILLAEELGAARSSRRVTGGATRAASVRAGARRGGGGRAPSSLVHDAARPLVTDAVIERVLAPLAEGWDGAVPGLPVADTVKRVDGGAVVETLARDELVAVQTPQAFAAAALRAARAGEREATDCAALVEARGGRVRVVEGDPRLLKVTTPTTSELVAAWL